MKVQRDKSVKHSILHRLKIARGHMDKVIHMVENDEYCIDVVHQSGAVQAALKKANQEILENHLRKCMVHEIHQDDGNVMVDELVEVIRNA